MELTGLDVAVDELENAFFGAGGFVVQADTDTVPEESLDRAIVQVDVVQGGCRLDVVDLGFHHLTDHAVAAGELKGHGVVAVVPAGGGRVVSRRNRKEGNEGLAPEGNLREPSRKTAERGGGLEREKKAK